MPFGSETERSVIIFKYDVCVCGFTNTRSPLVSDKSDIVPALSYCYFIAPATRETSSIIIQFCINKCASLPPFQYNIFVCVCVCSMLRSLFKVFFALLILLKNRFIVACVAYIVDCGSDVLCVLSRFQSCSARINSMHVNLSQVTNNNEKKK